MTLYKFVRFFHFVSTVFLINSLKNFSQDNNNMEYVNFHNLHDVFWINATYIAEDMGLNLSFLCPPILNDYQDNTIRSNETNYLTINVINKTMIIQHREKNLLVTVDLSEEEAVLYVEYELLAHQLGLNSSILHLYENVAINLGQICKFRPRILWLNDSTVAKSYNLNTTLICARFTKTESTLQTINITHTNETQNLKDNELLGESEYDLNIHSDFINASMVSDTIFVITINEARELNLNPNLFSYHESIGVYLPGACKPNVERKIAVKTFNATEQLGASSESDQNIDISSETLKVNLTELEETLTNDTAVDNILNFSNETYQRPFGGSFLLPIISQQKYDAFKAPAVLENQTVEIKFGIYIESISNFQSDTMDYEMDLYLRMAWRDPRLVHNLSQSILCKEEEIVKKLWRPDPFFSNSREANFHDITFLNFIMRIFPTGEVLSEMRIRLKPSCNLILCKYPHDKQRCTLYIKSFAYPVNFVKFLWFSNAEDAVRINPVISLPELSLVGHSTDECDGTRSTGNFSCLKVAFLLKREIGFHVAQTYIPTALALVFTWIPVWMPSELMEARLAVPLTVIFTLSGDAAATTESLPAVSYLKAFDYWYNFITIFVFLTMLQTIVVLLLERKRHRLIVKSVLHKEEEEHLKTVAYRYHKARILADKICRYLYPVVFVCFLCIYCFVIIQDLKPIDRGENSNKKLTFWINATYKAEDIGLNLSILCLPYEQYWEKISASKKSHNIQNQNISETNITIILINDTVIFNNETYVNLSEPNPVFVQNISTADKLGVNISHFNDYKTLSVNLATVCRMDPRRLWINESTQSRDYHLNTTIICIPFREQDKSLNSTHLDELLGINSTDANVNHTSELIKTVTKNPHTKNQRSLHDDVKNPKHKTDSANNANLTNATVVKDLELNISSLDPVLYVLTPDGAVKLDLNPNLFDIHESIAIYLPGACAPLPKDNPDIVGTFNASEFGSNTEENIGINVEKLQETHNLTELQETLSNDTEVKSINANNETEFGIKGGSYIVAILDVQKYDGRSHPTAFLKNFTTDVHFGIYVESLANFQTDTMDYDMDLYLIMSWRDARLSYNFTNDSILVKEEDIRDKIWRPDPYFANAKEASFQDVTFLNFLMKIYPSGKVLYEIRIKLKPSCNLVLCKFPHDHQKCSLIIRSFAYPVDVVKFHWFENEHEAINLNSEISLPELYITRTASDTCDGNKSTGSFSCLKAEFYMKRSIGFHAAQTYVPTTLAVMFSWVGVWLPEELTEPRIGIAITVLLTLSTESAGASEHLPSVSYTKAIDIWFEVMTAFVFFSLLETLFVIGFSKKAKNLVVLWIIYHSFNYHFLNIFNFKRKYASRKAEDEETKAKYKRLAERYHKAGIYFDIICRLLYPLVFVIFLMIYFFVLTQGSQNDCINRAF